MGEREISTNLIYWGLHHLVWVIDKLGYEYMVNWRNQMSKWMVDMEKRCKWVGSSQRNYEYCNECLNK